MQAAADAASSTAVSASPEGGPPAIRGLHHAAFRCRDSEETRRFYEDFLGLPLVAAFEIGTTQTGRKTQVLHTFFEMGDGSAMAFFEAPGRPFGFKEQHDFDLHMALEVQPEEIDSQLARGRALGYEVRGVSDHGFIRSIYFRDPNGYVVELTAKKPKADAGAAAAGVDQGERLRTARAALDQWQRSKASGSRAE